MVKIFYSILEGCKKFDGIYDVLFSYLHFESTSPNTRIIHRGELDFKGVLVDIDEIIEDDKRVKVIREAIAEANKKCKFDLKSLEEKLSKLS